MPALFCVIFGAASVFLCSYMEEQWGVLSLLLAFHKPKAFVFEVCLTLLALVESQKVISSHI